MVRRGGNSLLLSVFAHAGAFRPQFARGESVVYGELQLESRSLINCFFKNGNVWLVRLTCLPPPLQPHAA